ncbi:MAG: TolC family protein [Fimbriimonadales bacterium]|nr:TolC family protein [Fimbriimonadales bacterium]
MTTLALFPLLASATVWANPSLALQGANSTPSNLTQVETSQLSLNSFLRTVDANFPKMMSVRLESNLANSKAQEKRGAFDPVFSFNSDFIRYNPSSAPGKAYETQMSEGTIEVLDRSGAKLAVGARLNNGRVKSPGNSTGDWGEYFVSAKIPLIRDRLTNAKTVAEKQALLGVPLADQFIRQTRFDVLQKAGDVYWDWVGAGEKLRINQALYDLAVDRAKFIKLRVEAGANPAIDNAEANAEVFRRKGSLEKAERDLQKSELKLQFFLWNQQTIAEPKPLQRTRLPLLASQFELPTQNAIDAGPGTDLGGGGIGLTYKTGLFYSIPLRQNTADGRIIQVQVKLQKLDLEEKQTRQGILIEVSDAVSSLKQTLERVKAAELEVTAARELERGEKIRFDNGSSTLFLINQRERGRAEAEIRYADVRVEMEQANLNYLITTTQIMKSMEPATTKLLTSVKPEGAPRG